MIDWIYNNDNLIDTVQQLNLFDQEILFKLKYQHKDKEEHRIGKFNRGANDIIVVVGHEIFFSSSFKNIVSFIPLNKIID